MRSILIAFLLFPLLLVGQSAQDEIKLNIFSNPFSSVNQNYIRMLDQGEEYQNFYLTEDWSPMVVIGNDDVKLEVDSANYLIEEDKIYFIKANKLYFLQPGQVDQLALNKALFVCHKIEDKQSKRKLAYFELLVEGDITLLRRYLVKEKKEFTNPMGIGSNQTTRYKTSELYYIDPRSKLATPLPNKKIKLIELFRRKRTKMIKFARERDLSLKNEQHVQLMFAYYNMLIEADNQEKESENN